MIRRKHVLPDFFTRDKKPAALPLILLTGAAAGIIAFFAARGAERYAVGICITLACYEFGAAAALFVMFRQQIGYDPYSYNTIFYMGFSLFALSVMLMHFLLAGDMLREPDVGRGIMTIHILSSSAKNFILFSAPFLLAFSVGLCISNISLLTHERKRLVNLLGILLSFMIIGGWVFLFAVDYYVTGSQFEVMMHDLVTNLLAALYLYFECMLIGTIIAGIIAARYEPDPDRDVVIILGCGIRKDGTPTPLLASRIDRALQFAGEQKKRTGREVLFVPSGGQGADEAISESACMKQYLIEHGIPKERIAEENRSANTSENMRFSKKIISGINPDAKIAFATNNYHVFRSGCFASEAGLRAVGMGAATKWYFWPNAAVREFAGLLSRQKGRQFLILGTMAVITVMLTILEYLPL